MAYSLLPFFLISGVLHGNPQTQRSNGKSPINPTPEFVKILQQDTTTFRVLKIHDGQPIYDNSLAYWRISNAYGYQGAKMRIYQDMVDVAGWEIPCVAAYEY